MPMNLEILIMKIWTFDSSIFNISIYRSLIPIYLDISIIENFDSSIFDNLTLDIEIMDVYYQIEKELGAL